MVFSPDGKRLATADGQGGAIRLWDNATGSEVAKYMLGRYEYTNALAFSPDGKKFASGKGDEEITIWDIGLEATQPKLLGISSRAEALAFSADSKELAAGHLFGVELWDIHSGTVLLSIGDAGSVQSVAFSPNNKQLASAGEGGIITLWDTQSGEKLEKLEGHLRSVSALAFSPNGTQLASVSDDRTIRLWDMGPEGTLQTIESHSGEVICLAFSQDGKQVVSGSEDETVKLWNVGSEKPLLTVRFPYLTRSVSTVAISPDGKKLASKGYEFISLTNLDPVGLPQPIHYMPSTACYALLFSSDAKWLAGAFHSSDTKIWDASSRAVSHTLRSGSSAVPAITFSSDNTYLLSGNYAGTVELWNVITGDRLKTFHRHLDSVFAVAFSSDGNRLASSSRDHTVMLWDTKSGDLLQTLYMDRTVPKLSFSADGTFLQTERGPVFATTLSNRTSAPAFPPVILVEKRWISRDHENILWLPQDYESSTFEVHESTLYIGCRSGRVIIMEFAP